jgi:hypothetical protein
MPPQRFALPEDFEQSDEVASGYWSFKVIRATKRMHYFELSTDPFHPIDSPKVL